VSIFIEEEPASVSCGDPRRSTDDAGAMGT
jgi:hypothetical protein